MGRFSGPGVGDRDVCFYTSSESLLAAPGRKQRPWREGGKAGKGQDTGLQYETGVDHSPWRLILFPSSHAEAWALHAMGTFSTFCHKIILVSLPFFSCTHLSILLSSLCLVDVLFMHLLKWTQFTKASVELNRTTLQMQQHSGVTPLKVGELWLSFPAPPFFHVI